MVGQSSLDVSPAEKLGILEHTARCSTLPLPQHSGPYHPQRLIQPISNIRDAHVPPKLWAEGIQLSSEREPSDGTEDIAVLEVREDPNFEDKSVSDQITSSASVFQRLVH